MRTSTAATSSWQRVREAVTQDATRPPKASGPRWMRILLTGIAGYKRGGGHNISLIAAGVAFYGFLALVPTLIAATLGYGLVTDPADVQSQVDSLAGVLPVQAQQLLSEQMTTLSTAGRGSLSLGVVIALALALFSASGGIGNLVVAVNIAYGQQDDRNFVVKKVMAIALTFGAVLFFAVTMTLVAVLPAVADNLDLSWTGRIVLEVARWVGILLVLMFAIGVLYRVAPAHHAGPPHWVSPGAAGAMAIWLIASVGFSVYADNFSSYGKTYGSLAGVVVVMLWLWLSTYAVLLGAEMDAIHQQPLTAADDTVAVTENDESTNDDQELEHPDELSRDR